MNTVKLGTLGNIALKAFGLNTLTRAELVDEIKSQDYMCMNPDFYDATELTDVIINHKDEELDWEYEWDQDGFYYVWSKIDDKDIGFILWSDDIADELDMEFDGEGIPGDEEYDMEYFKRMRKVIEGE